MNQSTTRIRPPAAALRLLLAVVLAVGLMPLPAYAAGELVGQALGDKLQPTGDESIVDVSTLEQLSQECGSALDADKTIRIVGDISIDDSALTVNTGADHTLVLTSDGAHKLTLNSSLKIVGSNVNLSNIHFVQNTTLSISDESKNVCSHVTVSDCTFEMAADKTSITAARMQELLLESAEFTQSEGVEVSKPAISINYCGTLRLSPSASITVPGVALAKSNASAYAGNMPTLKIKAGGSPLILATIGGVDSYNGQNIVDLANSPDGFSCSTDGTVNIAFGTVCATAAHAASVASGVENGTVSLSAPEGKELSALAQGDTVTVTATPAEGYELESLYYVADGSDAQVKIEGGSFQMPAANVTVHATFRKTAAQEAADMIGALGEDPSDDDVEAALKAFDGLTDEQKAAVPAAAVAKLLGAQQKVAAAKLEKAKADAAAAEESRVKAVSDAVAAQAKAAELQKQVEAAQAAQKAAESKAAEAEKARKAAEAKAAEAEKKAAAAAQPAAKKANTMTAKGKTVTVKLSKAKKKAQTLKAAKAFTVKGAQGKVTYKVAKWGKSAKKYLKVASNGKVTVKKGAKKGTYTVKVKVTAAGNAGYKAASKTVTLKVRVA